MTSNARLPLVQRYVRLANSAKLSDRYVSVQIKEGAESTERTGERLYALVEIENPWSTSAQIGQAIINTLARTYAANQSADPLGNFEEALRKVNESLSQLAKTGETDWIGHLSAAFALVVADQVHLATTGDVSGWLVRAGRSSIIVSGGGKATTTQNVFSSVLSGELESGDRLVLATSGLGQLTTESERQRAFVEPRSLAEASARLAGLLRAKRGRWVNGVILDVEAPELIANRPLQRLSDTVYLDARGAFDWRLSGLTLLRRLHQATLGAGHYLQRADRALDQAMRRHVLPRSRQLFGSAKRRTSEGWRQLRQQALPALRTHAQALGARARRPQTAATEASPPPPLSAGGGTGGLIGKPLFVIHDYQASTNPEILQSDTPQPHDGGKIHTYEPVPPLHPRPKLVPSLRIGWALAWIRRTSSRSFGIGLLALVLVVILIVNLRALADRQAAARSLAAATEQLTDQEKRFEEAKLAKIFNQTDKALDDLQAVLTGTAELAGTPKAEQAQALHRDAQAILDELTSTTRLSNTSELLVTPARHVAAWGEFLTVQSDAATLTTIKQTGGELSTLALPSGEQIVAPTAFDEKEGLAVLTDRPAVYQANQAAGPLEAIDPGDEPWKRGGALVSFFNSLYLLASSDNQIWKYPASEGVYGKAEGYVTDGTSIDGAVDLAIDGNVYVLTRSGELIRFNRGKREELRVRDIPGPNDQLTEPKQVEVSGEAIFVLDAHRIVKLALDGRFQNQYALPDDEPIVAFALKDSTLFLLTGQRLLRTDL